MVELTCRVIEINRGTTHDGPGMRTTVFFKGCPLHCTWCQNPEGIDFGQDIWWEARKCIRCLSCIEACPNAAILDQPDRLKIEREECDVCGACVEACPSQAMTFTGKEWTLSELVRRVLKDRDFFAAFGGGVTASGGEPLGQYPFVAEFFRLLKADGIHTALDTCGYVPFEAYDAVLPYTDHVLFDLKILDPEQHRLHTGKSNRVILENLLALADHYLRPSQGKRKSTSEMKLWIRTPLIPETTATEENLLDIGRFIQENLADVVERWELCTFNSACVAKYTKLDLSWEYAQAGLLSQSLVDMLQGAALSTDFPSEKLVVSGLYGKIAFPSSS